MIDTLVAELRREQSRWKAAMRRDDDLAIEQTADRGDELLRALEASNAGRSALEGLLSDGDPALRLGVAGTVVKWAPEKAVPILARLMHEELDMAEMPWMAAGIRMNARLVLMQYFALRESMELPDRLADMGIGLPDWLARELRRE